MINLYTFKDQLVEAINLVGNRPKNTENERIIRIIHKMVLSLDTVIETDGNIDLFISGLTGEEGIELINFLFGEH